MLNSTGRGKVKNPRILLSGTLGLLVAALILAGCSTSTNSASSENLSTTPTPSVPAEVAVPELVGIDASAVVATLATAGLYLGPTTYEESALPPNSVIAQDPEPGASVTPGSQISVVLAKAPAPKPTPKPPVRTAPKKTKPQTSSNCDPNYTGGCVPSNIGDVNCSDIDFSVKVVGVDIYRLDRDGNGTGCESNS